MVLHKKPGVEEPRARGLPPLLSHRALWSVANRFSALHRECFATDREEGLSRIQESNSKREEGCRFNLPSQKSRRRRVTLSDLRPWELFVVLPRDNFFGGATVSLAEFYGFFGGETDNSFLPSKVPQSH